MEATQAQRRVVGGIIYNVYAAVLRRESSSYSW
jgi:hypothetical protein